MSPIEAINSPQIALLRKEEPLLLGTRITSLLLELIRFTNCSWTDSTVGDVAKLISEKFWMLRFDELIYVFRRGMEGAYGKVSFAPLTYSTLSQWLIKYQETERLDAEEFARNRFKTLDPKVPHVPTGILKKLSDDMMEIMAEREIKRVEKISRSKLSNTNFDDKYFSQFEAIKADLDNSHLESIKSDCKKNNFPKTLSAVKIEIQKRGEKK